MIYLNDLLITPTLFPDNTSQVWKLPTDLLIVNQSNASVKWTFDHEGEFLQLAQLKTLLDKYIEDVSLELTYLPYGRQDKKVSNDSTFALTTFARLLNTLNFQRIVINDPHSSVATDLIKNSIAVFPMHEIDETMKLLQADYVCYPDAGALEKYASIYRWTYSFGEKVRDQTTGNIISYHLEDQPFGKNILIVDDICDGGATFKLLAKELLAAGATEVNLFVSHGIFSRGLKTLKESGIKRIFTPDGELVSENETGFTYRRL